MSSSCGLVQLRQWNEPYTQLRYSTPLLRRNPAAVAARGGQLQLSSDSDWEFLRRDFFYFG